MRARTIGQIATLIGEQLGADGDAPAKPVVAEAATSSEEIDLDSISDEDIDLLLGGAPQSDDAVPAGKN
jgi:hypothetical protein